jgi:hypothetical protein
MRFGCTHHGDTDEERGDEHRGQPEHQGALSTTTLALPAVLTIQDTRARRDRLRGLTDHLADVRHRDLQSLGGSIVHGTPVRERSKPAPA